MIPILCQCCDVHIYDLDPLFLAWPLTFEMFKPVSPNVRLPHGKMHTDIYCSVCFGPPIHWDAGDGVMGKWLKVRGPSGPVIIETAKLIEKWADVPKPVQAVAPDPLPAPKKVRGLKAVKAKPGRKPKKHAEVSRKIDVAPPELKAVMAQVEGKESEEPPETSKDEILAARREQDREREALARDKQQRPLRPYSGR